MDIPTTRNGICRLFADCAPEVEHQRRKHERAMNRAAKARKKSRDKRRREMAAAVGRGGSVHGRV